MQSLLLSVHVPEDHHALLEHLVKTAVLFLGARGAVESTDVGSFQRRAKGKSAERSRLTWLSVPSGDVAATARALEGVLRTTLTASGVTSGEVRVLVRVDEAG